MSLRSVISELESLESRVVSRLRSLQNADGGFKAFYSDDSVSGIWSTSGAISALVGAPSARESVGLGRDYLASCQNDDGGWGFRKGGKSITDITAWTCLALDPEFHESQIFRGLEFLLRARVNTSGLDEDGWGLTSFESDRVYSTWIAAKCLRQFRGIALGKPFEAEIDLALAESFAWIQSTVRADGSWGPSCGGGTKSASTAVALLALFEAGDDPVKYKASCTYILAEAQDRRWAPESELIVTQEGYELEQTWFTSALCFMALIEFAKHGVATVRQLHETFEAFSSLILPSGQVVLSDESTLEMIWPIPYFIFALRRYKNFLGDKGQSVAAFLSVRQREIIQQRKLEMSEILQERFPYPISHGFFVYQHELDHHRRFDLMLQLYEVCIKFSAIVGLSGFLLQRETDPSVVHFVERNFRMPSLGHWTALLLKLLKTSKGFERLIAPQSPEEIIGDHKLYLHPDDTHLSLGEALDGIVQMRNSMSGHGAVRNIHEYKQICDKEEDKIYSFLERFSFLTRGDSFLVLASNYDEFGTEDRYHIRIFRGLTISDNEFETPNRLSEGQRDDVRYIYFQNLASNVIVNLYPFLSYMYCAECKHERFFFFNNMKGLEAASYLSFECGHTIVKQNGQHFLKRLQGSSITWAPSN